MDNESEGMFEASLALSSQTQLTGCLPKREGLLGLLICIEQLTGFQVDRGSGFTHINNPAHSAILRLTSNGYTERGNSRASLLTGVGGQARRRTRTGCPKKQMPQGKPADRPTWDRTLDGRDAREECAL